MKRFFSLLGFAQNAGRIASGEMAVEQAVKRKKAALLIVAGDASAATADRFVSLARRSGLPVLTAATKMELGLAIGRSPRSCLAINDSNFANALSQALRGEEYGGD